MPKNLNDNRDRTPSKKPGFPTWAWFAIGGGVGIVLIVGLCAVGGWLLWFRSGPKPTIAVVGPDGKQGVVEVSPNKVWELPELEKLLLGKSPDQVVSILGKADTNTLNTRGDGSMMYLNRINDKYSNNKRAASVWFRSNAVYKVD